MTNHSCSIRVSNRPSLVVIGGLTASGKSPLGMALAERFGGVIIAADSRQVYRGFDIGTAKPSAEDRGRVPHELVDVADPTETYTVATFKNDAAAAIERAHATGRLPILVGGTGFYIRALLGGTAIPPVSPDPERRTWLMGRPDLWDRVAAKDPEAAARLHRNDRFRLARALEVVEATGRPLSSFAPAPPAYETVYLVASAEKAVLAECIARRVDEMLEKGWQDEVEHLIKIHGADLPLLKTLGYAELVGVRSGDITLAEATELIATKTRRFARRQRVWFRGEKGATWLDPAHHGNLSAWIAAAERLIQPLLGS